MTSEEANQIDLIEAFPCFKENKLTLFLTSSFQSSLKTTITFWCFVFVTLFNLQGTRCVLQRFLMISLRFPFVKNFFQKFFSLFSSPLIRKVLEVLSPAFGSELLAPRSSACLYYQTRRGLSTLFYVFFPSFLLLFLCPSGTHILPQKTLLQKNSSYDTLIHISIYNM